LEIVKIALKFIFKPNLLYTMKKIFSFIVMSLVFVSCGTQVVTDEARTADTSEVTTKETVATQEPETKVTANTETKKILVTSSIIPLSSVVNTIG
jgi:uncharacterized protein YacL